MPESAKKESQDNVMTMTHALLNYLALGIAIKVERSQSILPHRFIEKATDGIADVMRSAKGIYLVKEWRLNGPFGALPTLLGMDGRDYVMAGLGDKDPSPHIVWHIPVQPDFMPCQMTISVGVSRANNIFLVALVTIPFSDSDEPVAKINWHWQCKMPDFIEKERQLEILMRSFKDVLAPETREQTLMRTYRLEDL